MSRLNAFSVAVRSVNWGNPDEATAMAAWAEDEVRIATAKAVRKEVASYKEWLREGPAGGLSRQHASSKCSGLWVANKMIKAQEERGQEDECQIGETGHGIGRVTSAIRRMDGPCLTPANIQEEVDEEARRWGQLWQVGMTKEEVQWPENIEMMPPLKIDELREAAKWFKDGTGLGWDRLHPRALLRLPDWL